MQWLRLWRTTAFFQFQIVNGLFQRHSLGRRWRGKVFAPISPAGLRQRMGRVLVRERPFFGLSRQEPQLRGMTTIFAGIALAHFVHIQIEVIFLPFRFQEGVRRGNKGGFLAASAGAGAAAVTTVVAAHVAAVRQKVMTPTSRSTGNVQFERNIPLKQMLLLRMVLLIKVIATAVLVIRRVRLLWWLLEMLRLLERSTTAATAAATPTAQRTASTQGTAVADVLLGRLRPS